MLTSLGFRMHPAAGIAFDDLKTDQKSSSPFAPWIRYGQSKLANILYMRELARRYPSVTTVAVHPGVVRTGLVEDLGFVARAFVYVTNRRRLLEPDHGTWNLTWAASAHKANLESGQLYKPIGIESEKLDCAARDGALAGRFWEWTEEALVAYTG